MQFGRGCETMAAPMNDRTNHRRVLHFAVSGMLLGGAVGCTSNEPAKDAKGESKTDAKEPPGRVIVNQDPVVPPEPEPEVREFAPNPGPNERGGVVPPVVAPTTAVTPVAPPDEPIPDEPIPDEPIQDEYVNERPVEEPTPVVRPQPDRKLIDKRVNTQRVPDPVPAPIKVNPGPER